MLVDPMTVTQAARLLGVTPQAVSDLVSRGVLAATLVGHVRLIERFDVLDYQTRHATKRRPGPKPASGEGS